MLAYEYIINIDLSVGAPDHGRNVVAGLNSTEKPINFDGKNSISHINALRQ